MQVRFFGTRGSLPVPGPGTVRYGGNTSCVAVRTARDTRVFTPVVLQMIAVGEESGALDDLTDEIADLYQREVQYELKTLSAQIEPLLIVLLGVLVLVLALGIFLPMWDLSQAMFKR